mgnify:CR=1 FL=1
MAQALEQDAEVMSNTQLDELLVSEPPEVRQEIISYQHGGPADRSPGGAAGAAPRWGLGVCDRAADEAAARSGGRRARLKERSWADPDSSWWVSQLCRAVAACFDLTRDG